MSKLTKREKYELDGIITDALEYYRGWWVDDDDIDHEKRNAIDKALDSHQYSGDNQYIIYDALSDYADYLEDGLAYDNSPENIEYIQHKLDLIDCY